MWPAPKFWCAFNQLYFLSLPKNVFIWYVSGTVDVVGQVGFSLIHRIGTTELQKAEALSCFLFPASFSCDSDEDSRVNRTKRRADSSEEDSQERRRRLALKRRRASEDDDSDDSDKSSSSSEEDRPIRKRVNRIDSDDDDEEEEEKPKEKKAEEESKGTTPLDCNLVELPPTNGQSPTKGLEGLATHPVATAPSLIPHLEPPKSITATPVAAIAPNGLVGQEMAAQDDDEDDLLGVTDLVDYVCNNEEL